MEHWLEALYEECKQLVLDSKSVVEEVERYRNDWKPKKTTVVLLAESHAHTTDEELGRLLKKRFNHRDGTRSRYVNFVYCIGNSESYALEGEEPTRRRTWQYWKILYSCIHPVRSETDFQHLEAGSSSERVGNKMRFLNELRDAGIWLLDASIVGINVLDRDARIQVMRKCWEMRLASLFRTLKKEGLRCVVIIGKTVEDALSSDLKRMKLKSETIPQPQARIKGGYLPYYTLIHKIGQKYRIHHRRVTVT